jgi:hypothetical protein
MAEVSMIIEESGREVQEVSANYQQENGRSTLIIQVHGQIYGQFCAFPYWKL